MSEGISLNDPEIKTKTNRTRKPSIRKRNTKDTSLNDPETETKTKRNPTRKRSTKGTSLNDPETKTVTKRKPTRTKRTLKGTSLNTVPGPKTFLDTIKNTYDSEKASKITNFRRKTLLEISNNNKELFDIFDMNWVPSGNTILNSTKYISTPELVKKYSILIDIEGNGYSGRLKHLLWSHRPLLIVDRPHKEYFFEFLKEWEHYIPVKRDLSDLIEKTKWCIDNYDKALQLAENAYQFSKLHLTRNACYDKWNNVIISNCN